MDPQAYAALYEGPGLTIDASTSYLSSPKAFEAIRKLRPDAKILISLRNPVKQMWSGFMMHEKFSSRDPEEWLNAHLAGHAAGERRPALEAALYGKYVPKWLEDFDCHIIEAEFMRTDGQAIFDGICEFLGVPRASIPELDPASANVFRRPRSGLARYAFNSKGLANLARATLPLAARQRIGNALLKADKKPQMPASWPEQLWPIFVADVKLLRDATGHPFSTLGP
jgi:hypothetical protein